jgi:tripartite-type tricarboxylate transporter receptor subunit TctC
MAKQRQLTSIIFTALAILLAFLAPSSAQDYPSRPIRIVVGFGPGSTADVLARLIGNHMRASLGQQFVVENKPGAGSGIAAEFVARSAADGYTLFTATVANTIGPALAANPTFNLARDLAPIALIGVTPNVLVAHPSVKAANVKELVALAKASPESLTFASSGAGTAAHLAAELFNQRAGVKLPLVPYAGSAQAAADLIAGRVSLMFGVGSTMVPLVNDGKLKAFAVAQDKRAGVMPNVPTMAEAGMPGFDAGIWVGLAAPAGTPPDIVAKLSRAVNDALKSPESADAMRKLGLDALGGSPEDFARFIKADSEKWMAVTAAAGMRK